jgi:thiamine biosynthesis lipoprotein ApbE
MKRPLVIAFVAISMVPLFAPAQQPDMAKLKADAQKVVSIISHDKAKSQIYCQINDLSDEIDQEKDSSRADALVQKINDLEKQLGPEYLAVIDAIKDIDPNSKGAQDIAALFNELDASCPD